MAGLKDWCELTSTQKGLVNRRLATRFSQVIATVESIEQIAEGEENEAERERLAKRVVALVVEAEALAAAVVRLGWRPTEAEVALDRARLTVRLLRTGGTRRYRRRRGNPV